MAALRKRWASALDLLARHGGDAAAYRQGLLACLDACEVKQAVRRKPYRL